MKREARGGRPTGGRPSGFSATRSLAVLVLAALLALRTVPASPALAAPASGPDSTARRLQFASSILFNQVNVQNAFFGQPRNGWTSDYDADGNWGELVLRTRARWQVHESIALVAGGVAFTTFGTDYYGTQNVYDGVIDPLYVELGRLAPVGDGIALRIGRHDVVFGDGFLVGDGVNDDVAALWSIPRTAWDGLSLEARRGAFRFSALAADLSPTYGIVLPDGDGGEVRLDAEGRIYAADLEHAWNERARVGATGFVRDDDGATDEDLSIASLRGAFPLGRLDVGGELARQGGRIEGAPTEAWGGHADVTIPFGGDHDAYVKATYAAFSGDDASTEAYEGFLSWHYAGSDWNRWYYGDVVGATLLLNEDERVFALEGGWTVDERWSSRLFLLHYAFDTGASFGGLPPGASRHFADEAMFVLDFEPRAGWETWLLTSVALPGAAGRAVQGERATAELIWSVKYSF